MAEFQNRPPRRFLSAVQVRRRLGGNTKEEMAKTTFYEFRKAHPDFPAPLRWLGGQDRWIESEVEDWIEAEIQKERSGDNSPAMPPAEPVEPPATDDGAEAPETHADTSRVRRKPVAKGKKMTPKKQAKRDAA